MLLKWGRWPFWNISAALKSFMGAVVTKWEVDH